MTKAICNWVLGLAVAMGGCSSQSSTARVSSVEPTSVRPVSYHHTARGYLGTVHNRGDSDDGAMVRRTRTSFEIDPDSSSQHLDAQTASMLEPAKRHELSLTEFGRHVWNQTAVIVDAREPRSFRRGHVRGAINIPAGDEQDFVDQLRAVDQGEFIIIYCGGPDCHAGENVAAFLASHEYDNIQPANPNAPIIAPMARTGVH